MLDCGKLRVFMVKGSDFAPKSFRGGAILIIFSTRFDLNKSIQIQLNIGVKLILNTDDDKKREIRTYLTPDTKKFDCFVSE